MRFHHVHQKLVSKPLDDIASEVHRQLDSLGIDPPQGDVAITVGSRGIANIPAIVRACGEWLKSKGASPFMSPCMGSHNGGTAEGQREMVESLGMTEEAMGMPIRSSMEVVHVGKVDTGDVWMDKNCYDSRGTLVVNRVKLHTCFSGLVQSGLTKMIVIGMGKIPSAETFHSAKAEDRKDILLQMGRSLIDSGKIFGGLAILEDGFDQTAELHALKPEEFLEKEPALLEKHRSYFPSLPLDQINVLIVREIGKTYSGTGMDTNVIGNRGINNFNDLERPKINVIGALDLADASHGNAIGVGLADFISRRLRDKIDEKKTFLNTYTTGDMKRMSIPCTLESDEELFRVIRERYGENGWMIIDNTLHLEDLLVSPDVAAELQNHPRCEVDAESHPPRFENGSLIKEPTHAG